MSAAQADPSVRPARSPVDRRVMTPPKARANRRTATPATPLSTSAGRHWSSWWRAARSPIRRQRTGIQFDQVAVSSGRTPPHAVAARCQRLSGRAVTMRPSCSVFTAAIGSSRPDASNSYRAGADGDRFVELQVEHRWRLRDGAVTSWVGEQQRRVGFGRPGSDQDARERQYGDDQCRGGGTQRPPHGGGAEPTVANRLSAARGPNTIGALNSKSHPRSCPGQSPAGKS